MENIYLFMLIALTLLAVVDIVVGVSNDAINFLNSAIGSKALSMKTIMIVASLGIFIGAVFSSGMMEVARKGIFVPAMFNFDEIMIIFMTVMITDILLLDFFNTLGLPTSTTVSIVFNLLGAAVVISLLKITASDTETLADLGSYINTEKALDIIKGILMSVVIAFSIGALVQWLSRLVFTFYYEKKIKNFGSIFGGVSLTAILYFIIMKGLKGSPYYSQIKGTVDGNEFFIILAGFLVLTGLSHLFQKITKKSILIVVIAIGTFGLALAFSGNDLVNFIGVPMAAYHSWVAWSTSGIAAADFTMEVLDKRMPAEPFLLFIAGGIMVLTLWFSKKAKTVAETELSLSRQGDTHDKFDPNALSRGIVTIGTAISDAVDSIIPKSTQEKINKSFEKPDTTLLTKDQSINAPAFDLIRASINLIVAGILISIATTMKLPLSTTYVTFMVAMGTSLADRAWGRESAVYRVAGVLNVIGGWFFTAFGAFTAAGIVVFLIKWNKEVMIPILLLITAFLLIKNYLSHKKKSIAQADSKTLKKAESNTVQGIINESADNISRVMTRSNTIYTEVLKGLSDEDTKQLKKSKKGIEKLDQEIEDLRDNIFYIIKNLEETSVSGSSFYINILGYLTDIAQSLEYISKKSYKHVNNQHKKLRYNQIKDLHELTGTLDSLLKEIVVIFDNKSFDDIKHIINKNEQIASALQDKIQKQIERTRTEESSPKNTTLYFNILIESKNLVAGVMDLIEEYYKGYKKE